MRIHTDTSAISRAVQIAGGQRVLARAISVSDGLVWQWLNGYLRVAAHHCLPIQSYLRETCKSNEITVHDLRPDIFGVGPKKRAA